MNCMVSPAYLHGPQSADPAETSLEKDLVASCMPDHSANNCQAPTTWARWLIGRVYAYRPKNRRFKSSSSRHVGTLGKSFARSCLEWCFGMKLRHSIRAVSGAPLSSSGLEEAL